MGYRTNAYGEISVKSDAEKVAEIIKGLGIFDDVDVQGNSIEITAYQIKYYPEDYIVMYEDIAPYIVSGSIEFTGDDDISWLHKYENGNWIEYDEERRWVNPHAI